ncbi:WD40 repeat domain-containing protein [Cyanobacteria bacterium FACHB-471]|nr:WD40 repeat domain-containing protein [Cyanobacteria bacterium FACHB-471]
MRFAIASFTFFALFAAIPASALTLQPHSSSQPGPTTTIVQADQSDTWENAQLSYEIDLESQVYPGTVCPVYPSRMAVSPDSQTLAVSSISRERSCSNDPSSTLTLWNLQTGEKTATLVQGTADEWVSPNGDIQEPGSLVNIHLMGDVVHAIAFTPDGETVAAGMSDRTVKLWNARTGEAIRTLSGHQYAVHAIAISPDGQTLASGSSDLTVKLWNLNTGEVRRTLSLGMQPGQDKIQTVAFSLDGQSLVSVLHDSNALQLWNIDGQPIRQLSQSRTDTDNGRRIPFAFHPSGIRLASGLTQIIATVDPDNTIKLWNTRTGARVVTLTGHVGGIRSLTFSPDGRTLASWSEDGTVKLWSMRSLQLERTMPINQGLTTAPPPFGDRLLFSPDGQTLAADALISSVENTPSYDLSPYSVGLFNIATGERQQAFPNLYSGVSFHFTADGQRFIAVAGSTIQVWQR